MLVRNIHATRFKKCLIFEFSLNYTKLSTLAMRWEEQKKFSKKKFPLVGIEPGTSCGPLRD